MIQQTVFIIIPSNEYIAESQKKQAKNIQHHYEKCGHMVINPFELTEDLEKSFFNIAGRDPNAEEYRREIDNNIQFSSSVVLCTGWHTDAECCLQLQSALKNGTDIKIWRNT